MSKVVLFLTVPCDRNLEGVPGVLDAFVSREERGAMVTYGIVSPLRHTQLLETLTDSFPQDCWQILWVTALCKIVCVAPRLKVECSFPREAGDYFFSGFNSLRTFLLLKTRERTLSHAQNQWLCTHALLYHQETVEGEVVPGTDPLPKETGSRL